MVNFGEVVGPGKIYTLCQIVCEKRQKENSFFTRKNEMSEYPTHLTYKGIGTGEN